ncbi:MAG TPA: hypothetical protein VF862_00820 [Gemmatimonadales bacterium]
MEWRYFGTRDVRLARQWAGDGGVAVHENLFRLRGMRCAHLLAADEDRLVVAALLVGCQKHWLQRTRTLHFDLAGDFLARALIRCGLDPAHPPTRSVWSSR